MVRGMEGRRGQKGEKEGKTGEGRRQGGGGRSKGHITEYILQQSTAHLTVDSLDDAISPDKNINCFIQHLDHYTLFLD